MTERKRFNGKYFSFLWWESENDQFAVPIEIASKQRETHTQSEIRVLFVRVLSPEEYET